MTTYFNVFAEFNGRPAEKAYFVPDEAMARRAAIQDGAKAVYGIKPVRQNWLTQEQIGKEYAVLLLRAISFQIDAGVPAAKAVQAAIESEPNPKKRARLQCAIDALTRGASLSDALYATGLYDTTIKSILMAGERMGGGNAIVPALQYMESRKAAWKHYWAIIGAIIFEMSTALTIPPSIHWSLIPWIRENLPKSSPEQLQTYLSQLQTIEYHNILWMWFTAALLVAVGGAIFAWMTNPRARSWLTMNVLTKVPMIGEWYINDALSRSSKSVASMLTSGVHMADAIQTVIKATGNSLAQRFWLKAQEALKLGAPHGDAFASTGLLRKDEVVVLKSARGTAQIARALESMSAEREWRQKILSARIFRLSIVIMFVYIGITVMIGFNLFELFNAGLDMTMQSYTEGL